MTTHSFHSLFTSFNITFQQQVMSVCSTYVMDGRCRMTTSSACMESKGMPSASPLRTFSNSCKLTCATYFTETYKGQDHTYTHTHHQLTTWHHQHTLHILSVLLDVDSHLEYSLSIGLSSTECDRYFHLDKAKQQ